MAFLLALDFPKAFELRDRFVGFSPALPSVPFGAAAAVSALVALGAFFRTVLGRLADKRSSNRLSTGQCDHSYNVAESCASEFSSLP